MYQNGAKVICVALNRRIAPLGSEKKLANLTRFVARTTYKKHPKDPFDGQVVDIVFRLQKIHREDFLPWNKDLFIGRHHV